MGMPISIIINSPSNWVRKLLLQLKKEKPQAAKFFYQQLDVMFVISYWLMYNFFKILSSSRYSYIYDQIIF